MAESLRPDPRDRLAPLGDEEWELSLSEVIESLLKSWRAMLAGAVLAPLLVLGYSGFLPAHLLLAQALDPEFTLDRCTVAAKQPDARVGGCGLGLAGF